MLCIPALAYTLYPLEALDSPGFLLEWRLYLLRGMSMTSKDKAHVMKRICVYCGSSAGSNPAYLAAARELGATLLRHNIGLVYGGACVGLMGAVADTVLGGGGEVIGVMPQALVDKEVAHTGLSELHVVDSMHERKALMADLADGFIALPGGLGTLEELFEVLTWAQLGFHHKPCALLNVVGYYDGLRDFLQRASAEQFVRPEHRDLLLVEQEPEALLSAMLAYQPLQLDKWL